MKDNKFPEFWYESNACWGWVKNMEDLKEKLELQIDLDFGGLENKDEFLDKSLQIDSGTMNFGTRMEHTGKKTLRMFLIENGVDINLL
jgi:hypothetical protein